MYTRHRVPVLVGSNILTILVMILVYNALRPAPQHLTQRDIDNAVNRSLENAPPSPSSASVAYDAIRPSLVVVMAKTQEGGKARSTLGAGVVITDTGVILTCLHVVGDAPQVSVVFADGTESDAEVVVPDPGERPRGAERAEATRRAASRPRWQAPRRCAWGTR